MSANPDLDQELRRILSRADTEVRDIDTRLQSLEEEYRGEVYPELIYLLSHLRFDAEEARTYWGRIVEHGDFMERQLRASVDVRVALVSYFLNVDRKLRNPKIIELDLLEKAREAAYQDELTGLRNYRYFREYLSHEIKKCRQYGTPLSLVMLDVDDFKRFNDRNGHQAGNEVLAGIGHLLRASLRHVDVAARYGGEEFALILAMTPKTGARVAAENVRKAIAEHFFPGQEGQPGASLTVSAGLATCPADARAESTLIRHADEALYTAKTEGKNRVCLYGQSSRSFGRIRISLKGTFSTFGERERPIEAIEISEGGILLLTEHGVPPGTLVELSLVLAGSRGVVSATGRVASIGTEKEGLYRTGVRFLEIPAHDRMRLRTFIGDGRR